MMLSYFHIEWLSKLDGPGNRVVVFLQGCNLRCPWCHSPHSRESESPILFNPQRCINCRACVEVCKNQVHFYVGDKHMLQRNKCIKCGECIEVCPVSKKGSNSGALLLPTRQIETQELFELIRPQLDAVKSSGGITLSGGEALLQKEAVLEILKLCKSRNIHTAVETSLALPLDYYKSVCEYIDCWLVGLRGIYYNNNNGEIGNEITENVRFISGLGKEVIVRFPVIKGYTLSESVFDSIVSLMNIGGFKNIELLPCNPNMEHYYTLSGITLTVIPSDAVPNDSEMNSAAEFFISRGLNAKIGSI